MRGEERREECSILERRPALIILAGRPPRFPSSCTCILHVDCAVSHLHLLDLSLLSSLFWSESENRLGTCGGCTHSVCGRRRAAAGSPRLTPRPVCARETIYLHSGSHVHVLCVYVYVRRFVVAAIRWRPECEYCVTERPRLSPMSIHGGRSDGVTRI